jgi:chemotaxis protein methyltransferase CheR
MSDELVDAIPDVIDGTGSWVDVIHKASERIASLARDGARPDAKVARQANAHATLPPTARPWSLALVLEAMRQERFADALNVFAALPPDAQDAPDALLLRAALLTNSGRLDEAEAVCRQLLVVDELNAGAHYLMALCCEHAGNSTATVEHDQTAIYLDPGFAMPHLHLGLVARRAGDNGAARAELEQALTLLEREDASRLLLFGGGFSREMLLQLCRAELRAPGVAGAVTEAGAGAA